MSTWTIYSKAKPGDLDADITVSISVKVANDAPPTLVTAVGEMIGRLLLDMDITDEQKARIVAEIDERIARTQRQADHAARRLLGDGGEEGP
jgi:hypothetical protein